MRHKSVNQTNILILNKCVVCVIYSEPLRCRRKARTYLIICLIRLFELELLLVLLLQILTCLHSPSCVIVCPLGQLSGIVTSADLATKNLGGSSKIAQESFLSFSFDSFSYFVQLISGIESRIFRSLISSSDKQHDVRDSFLSSTISLLPLIFSENSVDKISVSLLRQVTGFIHSPVFKRTNPSSSQSDGMHIDPSISSASSLVVI